MGPVMGLTAVAGSVLGGVLTHTDIAGLSWRAVFLVNVPLGVIVLASACFLIEDRAASKADLDLVGVSLIAAVAAAITVPMLNQSMSLRLRALCLAAALLGVVTLIAHVRLLGKNGRDHIVEPSLFRDRGFPAALVMSTMYFAVSTGLVFTVVLYVQNGLHGSVLTASLAVLPFSLGLAVSSLLVSQKLLPRFGSMLMLPGIGILALGCLGGAVAASVAVAPLVASLWIPASLAVAGLGGGLFTVPFFTTALSRVRPHETGSAAGLLNSLQQLGGTLGVSLLGTIHLNHTSPGHSLTLVFAVGLALVLLVALANGHAALPVHGDCAMTYRNAPLTAQAGDAWWSAARHVRSRMSPQRWGSRARVRRSGSTGGDSTATSACWAGLRPRTTART